MTLHEVRALVKGTGLKRRLANEMVILLQSAWVGLRTPRPDVVITTVPSLSTLPLGWALSRVRRVPMVLELRDAWPHLLSEIETWNDDGTTGVPRLQKHGALGPMVARVMWLLERDAVATVVTTEALKKDLEARGQRAVAVARNANRQRFQVPPVDVERRGLRVLYLGSFGRAQKLSTAVRAARMAADMGVDIQLRLVGSGVHEEPLRRLAQRLDAPVEFDHRVPNSQVGALYEWADTVLVILRDWQGMELTVPSKLYEVMATGRHVSASIAGETAWIVSASGCGDVALPDNPEALARLWAGLAEDKSRLQVEGKGLAWLEANNELDAQAKALLRAVERATAPDTTTPWGRALGWARDVTLTGRTIAGHLDEDGATFFVQLARRTGLGAHLPQHGPLAWRILADHLGDRTRQFEEVATQWSQSSPGNGRLDRWAASVLLARGFYQQVPGWMMSPQDHARLHLEMGDLAGALVRAPNGSRLWSRIASGRRVLDPTFRVELPPLKRRSTPEPNRVLHVLTNYYPHTSSGYTLRSRAIMQAQMEHGWQVEAATRLGYPVTIGRLGNPGVTWVDGIAMHRLIPWKMPAQEDDRLTEYARRLDRVAEQRRPSILHTTTDYSNALAVDAVARRRGIPWVYEMRGQLELTWLSKRPAPLRERAEQSERLRRQRERETACAKAASAVVVLSEVQRADLVDRGVPADRITVVPNAVDQSLLKRTTTQAEARNSVGLAGEPIWVGAVSSVVDYEGFDVLLRAVALLRAGGRDVRCAIVGDGTARPALITLAKDLGIWDVCAFPGRVARDKALLWVEALDVVVVPRKDTPVCRMVTPLKPIEAMALGRPVVASDLPALRELLEPTGGTLVRPEDPNSLAAGILVTLEDPDSLRSRVEAGREWAARRTWQEAARRYDRLYHSLRGTP